VFGSPNLQHQSVLVQEFAIGPEFAVDTISKNGTMKIAAIWKYDKRPAHDNNHNNDNDDAAVPSSTLVYYATRLYSCDDNESGGDIGQILYDYLKDCLAALDIQWGITHSEVILTTSTNITTTTTTTSTGDDYRHYAPRLVEVNCRQHNMNFLPLTMGSIGYNIFDMLLAAYLGDDEQKQTTSSTTTVASEEDEEVEKLNWDSLPDIPMMMTTTTTRMNAAMIHLVNTKRGILRRVNEAALYEIQGMDSVWDLEVYHHFLEPGRMILPTVDIKTDAGWVQLLHPHRGTLERDYQRIIEELMPELFEVW
jgi:hypothetical protein